MNTEPDPDLTIAALKAIAAGKGAPVALPDLGAMPAEVVSALRAAGALEVAGGWAFAGPVELLDGAVLGAGMSKQAQAMFGQPLVLDSVGSTNSLLLEQAKQALQPRLVFAEQQSGGRGRRGRAWQSPFGCNIYCSVLVPVPDHLDPAAVSLTAGVAVAEAVAGCGVAGVGLKWPNDLLLANRKFAGILVEYAGRSQGQTWLVIGMGINRWLPESSADEIDQPWSDLAKAGADVPGRSLLAVALLNELATAVAVFQAQGFAPIRPLWQQRHAWQDQPVKLITPQGEALGIARGVDASGALLFDAEGVVTAVRAGEVSLRSMAGAADDC